MVQLTLNLIFFHLTLGLFIILLNSQILSIRCFLLKGVAGPDDFFNPDENTGA